MKTSRRPLLRWFVALLGTLVLPLGQVLAGPPQDIPPGLQKALEVQQAHQTGLLSRPGVVGIGIGLNPAGQGVLEIYTENDRVGGLPRQLDGVDVRARVTGRIVAQQALTPASRWPRPVPIGVSVGHPDITAGTLGVRVYKGNGGARTYYVLSNNHVLANTNLALIGDAILQPGPLDGGVAPADVIANLTAFQSITMSTTASNTMDAAIAKIVTGKVDLSTPLDGYGAPAKGSLSPWLNMAVMKYGRTTGLTRGTITGLNATVIVDYSGGRSARFVSQIVVSGSAGAFSRGGDSGSLVVAASGNNTRKSVGLLFAGNDSVSVASPIKPILSRFGVTINGQ